MAGLDKTIIDFSESGQASSGVIAIGAASVSAAVPANTELLMLTSTAAGAHFRIGVGTQTALAADPMVTAGITLVVKLDPSLSYNLAAIQDGSATGNLSYFRVYEG